MSVVSELRVVQSAHREARHFQRKYSTVTIIHQMQDVAASCKAEWAEAASVAA